MQKKLLKELKVGEKGKVIRVTGSSMINSRIIDMGITRGTEIEVERLAPLGDPVEIRLKGYHLSLRKDEAACILVEVEE